MDTNTLIVFVQSPTAAYQPAVRPAAAFLL